ncbi:methyltransferase domain-containing protein [Streptomyces sp. NBC_01381]|uniref:SAM-dependent methyltransferase n=1 Tax=Streptomyces sp. NBC_01381 TaxID=2903845 RepID=UPI002253E137|nr:methyltransferase domain-containing protein [Streptomyces sp. NBC_01381]MCX4671730.1 methyltransferase domain-containing protein [Streptomyces sp. NBC_01381]
MTADRRGVTAEVVGELYDQGTELLSALMGGSLHYGYWDGPADTGSMAEASRRMTDLMIDKLAVRRGGRVLDVGCGTGSPALRLARSTGAEVVGITISRQQVRLANLAAEAERLGGQVKFEHGDAADLRFAPGSFDAVWLFESLLHMPDPRRVLKQLATILRPGGRLVIANLVRRTPVTEAEEAGLAAYLQMAGIASIAPLDDYPGLVTDGGLVLDELLDVSDHSVRRTLECVLAALSDAVVPEVAETDAASEALGRARAVVEQFAATRGIGYALAVASKPVRKLPG